MATRARNDFKNNFKAIPTNSSKQYAVFYNKRKLQLKPELQVKPTNRNSSHLLTKRKKLFTHLKLTKAAEIDFIKKNTGKFHLDN